MINVGEKMTLKKAMGGFNAIGTLCTVTDVKDGVVHFRCALGIGGVELENLDTYFDVYRKKEDCEQNAECNYAEELKPFFAVGDMVELVEDNEKLAPMSAGERFDIVAMKYDTVILHYASEEEQEGMFCITEKLLYDYFKLVKCDDDEDECCSDCPAKLTPITDEEIDAMIEESELTASIAFGKCAIVACKLPNGFVTTASICCVDEEVFDEQTAIKMCVPQIKTNIRKFENYHRMSVNAFGCGCCDYCEDDE